MGPPRPLGASLAFARDGLVEGAVRERNLRLHLGLGVLVGAFVALAPLAGLERALLALCTAVVVGGESMNSGLEAAVDLASPGRDERARIAKDSAAGAVLALAAGSVLAFVAICAPRLDELAEWVGALGPGRAVGLGAAALAPALAASVLPAPGKRSLAADVLLGAAGVAGLGVVAVSAVSQVGTAVAALWLAVGIAGARRRRTLEPGHSS